MGALAPGQAIEKPHEERASFAGIPVIVDRPKGHVIEGVDSLTGQPFRVEYTVPYGYFPRTQGGDGEGLDVFLGPDESDPLAFWISHLKDDGSFDEFKVVVGMGTALAARALYLQHYPARWFGGLREGTVDQIRALLNVPPTGEGKDDIHALARRILERATAQMRASGREPARLLDLGTSDVHLPGGATFKPGPPTHPKELDMSDLTAAQRSALPSSAFAMPAERKYPIHDAAHVRAAESYLEKEHNTGLVSDAAYSAAKARIARAAKKFGVESKYAAKKAAPKGKRLHVRADLADGGSLHVSHHMGEPRLDGFFLPVVDISGTADGPTEQNNGR